MSTRKLIGRPFEKGRSGNPGGRPKGSGTVQEMARSFTAEAIETLAKLMRSSKIDRVRVAAAEALLDRGWGRPAQPVDFSWDLSRYTPEQLAEIEQRALAGEMPEAIMAAFAARDAARSAPPVN